MVIKKGDFETTEAVQALSTIRNGSRVFFGTGCGEPQHLIRTLVDGTDVQDVLIYQMLSSTLSAYIDDPEFFKRFSLKLFFISSRMRKAAFEGKIDYIPAYLSQIPTLLKSGRIGLDAALIQVSPPDAMGYCSMGVSVDITKAAVTVAKKVIAQVNPKMPRTWGDSMLHIREIDMLVEHEEPLVEVLPGLKDPKISLRIGYYVNQLISDGITLQVGFGHLPYAVLNYLDNKNDLGIHTPLISDAFLPLLEKGVITNRKKSLFPGKSVVSMCMGSEKIYGFVDDNPMFYFASSEVVNDPVIASQNDRLISLSSALEVDLTGQISSDSMGYLFFSGMGDQVDFFKASAQSKGGFSIVAIPSTAKNGNISRIVPHLTEGAGVSGTRGDVHYVVTEYGIAELYGKSIYQRVVELAQIAHPRFREALIDIAKKRHYIFKDQLPVKSEDLLFLEAYKSELLLKDGRVAMIRPLLSSDEFLFRNFFYSLKMQTIYLRFFHRMKLFSREMLQDQWADVDYKKKMSLIAMVRKEAFKEIVALGSYVSDDDHFAEVAFVVREDFQGMGIGTRLLTELEKIARENRINGFKASILRENNAMLAVFKKRYPDLSMSLQEGGEFELTMPFLLT